MQRTSALQHPHQTSRYNLRVPSGWLLARSFYSLAIVQPHNESGLDREELGCPCYNRTSSSNFGTVKWQNVIINTTSFGKELLAKKNVGLRNRNAGDGLAIFTAKPKWPWAKYTCAKFTHTSGIWTNTLPLAASCTYTLEELGPNMVSYLSYHVQNKQIDEMFGLTCVNISFETSKRPFSANTTPAPLAAYKFPGCRTNTCLARKFQRTMWER